MIRWYQRRWWYVERPFPWLLIVVWASVATPILLAVFGVIVGMHYLPWWH